MNAEEKIIILRQILKPVIDWYQKILDEGEPDGSYLYDTTYEIFNNNLTSGQYQEIIEILLDANQLQGSRNESSRTQD